MTTEKKHPTGSQTPGDLEARIEQVVKPPRRRQRASGGRRLPLWLSLLLLAAGLVGGLVMGRTLFADRNRPVAGPQAGPGEEAKTKYTCGMHPQIVQDEPGFCPICGMKLTPLKQEKKARKKVVTGEAACRGKKVLWYQAPMDPKYRSPEPGKSPMGMDLVPACESDEEQNPEGISIDPRIRQNMGVRLAEVRESELVKTIRTVGHVDYDERRLAIINTKIDGWVERLAVDYTGQQVKRGQLLLSLYSPKLIATQQELLIAARQYRAAPSRRTETMLEAARQRLRYWDITEAQIRLIESGGKLMRRLNIRAPRDGVVVEKSVFAGQHVRSGTTLLKLADLSRVWVLAYVYEMDAPFVRPGQKATIELPYDPAAGSLEGSVDYIYPWLDEKSRDLRVRLVFANPGWRLKPGMYVSMLLRAPLGRRALVVDDAAVLRSGRRNVVFVELEPGLYSPRQVELGVSTDSGIEVRSGLEPGQRVVVNGQFMLDSESRLREALRKFEQPLQAEAEKPRAPAAAPAGAPAQVAPAAALEKLLEQGCTHTCPMPEHFHVCGRGPGQCPECGMTLEPIQKLQEQFGGASGEAEHD